MRFTPEQRTRIMAEYTPWVETIARRRERSPLLEDELVQEGMIGLARAIEDFDPERGSLLTYSEHRIEYAMEAAERRSRRARGIPRAAAATYEARYDPVELAELVDRLGPRERAVLRRYFWEGATHEQIAVEMGVGRESVRKIKLRALERLRARMA